ncbi:glycosyltransferase family 4 protein [Nodosilinea sp. LEGE 07088]|uniref:glycosyltransferase family 4 protein n=1 Tax=Nodosilinea sp. LEGE 07088 TaxID=2777968 RepID=UPI00187F4C90|nr:glycosyltransferase family 4 protein [Nodosilinea sp. LEGE 07088]MBE9135943.1 glycosyltransferase family 4 protein [Nodosilinea sp. LEGE 07088]
MKVTALTMVTGPYIAARYTHFAMTYPNYELSLVEFGEVSETYSWQQSDQEVPYRRVILSKQSAEGQTWVMLSWRLLSALNNLQPEIVILCGYGIKGMLVGLLWSLFHQKPAILLSDSKENDSLRNSIKEFIKSLIIQKYDAALVAGQLHKQYLCNLGMPRNAIFVGYDVVENKRFCRKEIKDLPKPLDRPYFLAVNRFIAKKNLHRIIQAYADYRQQTNTKPWDLVLCGDGELYPQIEQKVSVLGLESSVHMPGFLQLEELLPYYAHAQCFIHASLQEQWGLVVNEAMAAGLPVIVSNCCGCFEDLVLEGVNGFGFDPENVQQLSSLMMKVSSDSVDLEIMGRASEVHIQNYSPETFSHGLQKAIQHTLK